VRVLSVRAQAVLAGREGILALAGGSGGGVSLVRVSWTRQGLEHIHTFNGSRGFLLVKLRDLYLASVDETLYISRDLVECVPR